MSKERNGSDRPTERWTPRSLVLSLLLGMERPRMAGADLVRWCGRFGVQEGTARVALSRMVERGELVADDGAYELVGRIRGRQREHDFSVAPKVRPWDGDWTVAIARAGARSASERSDLRDAMRSLRYAPLRDGVWTRPANLDEAAADAERSALVAEQCTRWTARPDDDPRALAERLFAPSDWATTARRLLDDLDRHSPGPIADDDLPAAFVSGARALQHLRRDPLLP
ncbi:MAG TPA: hypothetical protein VFZ83_15610, partial [Acidimicrobiia bacterium]|nr:hypothetical protein [Acidimicrobiia bacterium]